MNKEKILDDAADKMAEEILNGNPDIAKCFSIGLKAIKEADKTDEPEPNRD
ncbi:MAG: hypothetical protein V1843_05080 [bacterium]